jgi:hypothetical protein
MGEPIQEISASDGSELDGAQIFEMNRELPFPAMCLSRGEARAVMPSLDKELVGTIRKIAPRERGDRAMIFRSCVSEFFVSLSAFSKSSLVRYCSGTRPI